MSGWKGNIGEVTGGCHARWWCLHVVHVAFAMCVYIDLDLYVYEYSIYDALICVCVCVHIQLGICDFVYMIVYI